MPRSLPILLALALAACGSATTDYCSKLCSVKQGTGTGGPVDAEGGPLSASCPVDYSCNAASGMCVANDGHCTGTTGGGTSGGSTTGGTTGGATTSGGTTGGSSTSTGNGTSAGANGTTG